MTQLQIKKNRTSTLLRHLFQAPDLETFIKNNADEMTVPSFHAYISELCRKLEQVPEQIIKRSAIDRTYGHQLFDGIRKPSRDKVLQLAFGLDVGEVQELLKIARKNALYPLIIRDAAILRCLNDHKDIIEAQSVLQALGLSLLGGEEKHG